MFSKLPRNLKTIQMITGKPTTVPNKLITALVDMLNPNPSIDLKPILSYLMETMRVIIPNLNSLNMSVGMARKLMNAKYPARLEVNRILDLTDDEKLKRMAFQEKALKTQLTNEIKVEYKAILDIVDHVKESHKLADKIILACLASGRRGIEILRITDFAESKIPDRIHIRGVAKQKGSDILDCEIPLLFMKPKEFIDLIKLIRGYTDTAETKSMNNSRLSKKFMQNVINRVKKYFTITAPRVGAHVLRKIYGAIIAEQAKRADKSGLLATSEALGHHCLATTLHYDNIKILNYTE
tara:strand:- start:96 stop:983 length:888 start_codon:yes stop_codon:yes gene_type:complete